MLLDIQNGEIPDADTFAAKIAEYYEKTVTQGMPVGISPTLLSPALTAAASGVPTFAPISSGNDSFRKPNSYNSQLNMYRTLARYYIGKEVLSGQQDLEQTIDTLAGLVRKQTFNVQRVKVFIEEGKRISKQIEELPIILEDVKLLIKDIITEYRGLLKDARAELESDEFKQAAAEAGIASIPKVFAEEITIIDTVSNLKVDNIQNLTSTINIIASYFKKVRYLSQSPQDRLRSLVIRKIKTAVQRIMEAASALVEPRKIGSLLARLTSDNAEVKARIDKSLLAYKRFKQLEDQLRPRLIEIERRIKEEKEKAKEILANKIADIKDKIDVKMQQLADKRRKRRALRQSRRLPKSPKKELFKKAADDIKTLRKNNEENVKTLKRKIKTINSIIQNGNELIGSAVALKTKLIDVEVPIIISKLNEATGSILAITGTADTQGSLQLAATATSASAAQKITDISSSFNSISQASSINESRTAVKGAVNSLPFKDPRKRSTESSEIKQYFEERGLAAVAEPFMLLAAESNATFEDYRVFLEQQEDKFDEYVEQIKGYKPKLQKLIDDFKTLNDEKIFIEPVDMTSESRQARYKAYIERQRRRTQNKIDRQVASALKPKPKHTIVSVLKSVESFIQRIYSWLVRVVEKLGAFIKEQLKKAKKIGEQIKIAAIAALPIPVQLADDATKKQAAAEKLNEIKKYKKQLAAGRAKGEAIALVSRAAGPLLNNVATGKLRASENEKWLNQIADGKFKFDTVGLKPDSPGYTKAEDEKRSFKQNVTSLYILEKYVDLLLTTYKAVNESKDKAKQIVTQDSISYGKGFIDDLKEAAQKVAQKAGKRPDGSVGALADVASVKLVSTIIDLFTGEDPSFESIIAKLKRIYRELNGKVLSSLLQSVDYTQAFIDVEQVYLYDVQQLIRKIVGSVEPNEVEADEIDKKITEIENKLAKLAIAREGLNKENPNIFQATPEVQNKYNELAKEEQALIDQRNQLTNYRPIKTKDARALADIEKLAKRQAKQKTEQAKQALKDFNIGSFNFYSEMKRLDANINKGQGSFLVAIIDRIMWQINYIEQRLRVQIKAWIESKKEDLAVYLKKIADNNKDRLTKIKVKLVNADAAILTAVLNLSTRIFWTGSVWVNGEGTTFQTLSIGPFAKLKKNGVIDGGEAVIREIAANFEKQLNVMVGQAFPNPSYGIPPFVFNGYK